MKTEKHTKRKNITRWREARLRRLLAVKSPTERQCKRAEQLEKTLTP